MVTWLAGDCCEMKSGDHLVHLGPHAIAFDRLWPIGLPVFRSSQRPKPLHTGSLGVTHHYYVGSTAFLFARAEPCPARGGDVARPTTWHYRRDPCWVMLHRPTTLSPRWGSGYRRALALG